MSASGGDERVEEIRASFGKVWETLGLPPPRFLRFESESQTAARRRPRLTRDRRWGPDGRFVRWMQLRARVDAAGADRRSTPEDVERLERRLAFVRAAAARTPPPLADGEAADQSIVLLRRLERLCRDAGRVEELAVCLALRTLLARGATGGSGRERPAHLELERLFYRQVVDRTHAGVRSPGWDVSAALEELEEFLRDPFLDEELRGWAAGFDFTWVAAGGGRLALWHRPRLRAIAHLARAGCDRVTSVLGAGEGAQEIGRAVESTGLDWSWIPLESGRPPEGRGRRDRVAREGVAELVARLAVGESVLVHCSAGMHRTGMLAYAVLRSLGYPADESLALVERMRAVTAKALTPAHLTWGDGLAADRPGGAAP